MLIAQLTDLHIKPSGRLAYGVVDTTAYLTAAGDRLRVTVDRPDRAASGIKDGLGVAAAAEGAVEIDAAIARGEGGQHLGEHDGDVPGPAHAGAPGRVSPRERTRSRASARRRSAAAGSQIWKVRPSPMNTTLSVTPA